MRLKARTTKLQIMMEYRFRQSILATLLILACNTVKAEIVTLPRSSAIQIGSSAFFNCSSSLPEEIHWFHYAVGANERSFVYGYGKFYPPYEGNLELEIIGTSYNLIIPSARFGDAGKYECQDNKGSGDKKSAQLTVLEQGPVCKSDKEIDKIIGPNSCGIEADDVVLTCTIQYRGNEIPMLEWRNLATNKVIGDGITVGSRDNNVALNLTMKGDSSIDDASYLCQTRSSTPYSCNIGPVRVTGKSDSACNSYWIVTVVLLIFIGILIAGFVAWLIFTCRRKDRKKTLEMEEVSSPAEVVPLHGIKETSLTNDNNLPAKKISERSPKSKNVDTEKPEKADKRLAPERQQMQLEIERLQLKLTDMEQRLYPPENIKYLEKSKFLHIVRKESDSKDRKSICGVAVLDPSLFVVFEKSEVIEVYDSVTFNRQQPDLVVNEMTYPLDIASSKVNKCFYVYITNRVDVESKSSILKINLNGEFQRQWETDGGPGRLSTSDSTLIVCLYEKNKICEYSDDGSLLQTVSLSPACGFKHPLHAIKVTSMHFIVSHGNAGDALHRVCVVDLQGNVIKEFSQWKKQDFVGNSTKKMNVPICMAESSDRFVIVADRENKQILLLNSVLKFRRQLIVSEEIGLKYHPVRLAFGDKGNLFIAENCRNKMEWQSGRISVFATKNESEQST